MMTVSRVLRFPDGDALTGLRGFLSALWSRIEFDAMLAPVELYDGSGITPQVIEDPRDLSWVNPLAPLMTSNIASLVSEFVNDHPRGQLALVLRPCELRTWVELQKRHHASHHVRASHPSWENHLWLIGVECMGTLTADAYVSQVKLLGAEAVTREALSYGIKDGLAPKGLRLACQICDRPVPQGADLVIGTIGVACRQFLLVVALDELVDAHLRLQEYAGRLATENELKIHEDAVRAMVARQILQREDFISQSSHELRAHGGGLASFVRCTLCADCLDACPLYEGELRGLLGIAGASRQESPILAELVGVGRLLASCSGCGMCEEVCQYGVPLFRLVTAANQRIREEFHYTAGKVDQRFPWVTT